MNCPSLEQHILTALHLSVAEDRMDVAEHLLRALEAMEPMPTQGTTTAEAYRFIARMTKA